MLYICGSSSSKEMVAAPFHPGRFSRWPCLQILGSVTRSCVFILSSENMVPVPLHCWGNSQLLQKWSDLPPHGSALLKTTSKTWEGRSHVLNQSLQHSCTVGDTVVWNLDWTSWKPLMPWHKHWIRNSLESRELSTSLHWLFPKTHEIKGDSDVKEEGTKLVAVFVIVSNSLAFVHKNGDEQKQSPKLFVLEFACIMWFMKGKGQQWKVDCLYLILLCWGQN